MTPLRVSTTVLESYRLWSDPDQHWMSEADLMATIRGEFTPTPQILLGLAYHQIIEHPETYRVEGGDGYQCREYLFPSDAIAPMLAQVDRRGLFEVKATKAVDGCIVVAKCDHILGATISEFKTTTGSFDLEKYSGSYQWRFMSWLFGASAVVYRVACLAEGPIALKALESFALYPYAEMERDCRTLLRRFVDYVKLRKLDEFLREKQRKIDERAGRSDAQLVLEGL